MPLDLTMFASKLRRVREMFDHTLPELAGATGIEMKRLEGLESATTEPTGDEVLILADHYNIDFQFFISSESSLPVDRAEKLFRAYSGDLSNEDRLAIQEFINLCDNEAFLAQELARPKPVEFVAKKRGTYFIGHGTEAAIALRRSLAYSPREVPDIFRDIRRLGVHVFRRRLANPAISGLFFSHDVAGPCVLVNYDEDVYRQRFTAAHELAHALFDREDDYVVSFQGGRHKDLRESRADAFAGAYLVPSDVVSSLPAIVWTDEKIVEFAERLKVNAAVFAIALQREQKLTPQQASQFTKLRMPRATKSDPELPSSLPAKSRERKKALLERGMSSHYAELCFESFQRHLITRARLAELLHVDADEVNELVQLFVGAVTP